MEDPEVLWFQRNIIHHLSPEPHFGPETLFESNTADAEHVNMSYCEKTIT